VTDLYRLRHKESRGLSGIHEFFRMYSPQATLTRLMPILGLTLAFFLSGCGSSQKEFVLTGPGTTTTLSGTIAYERLLPLSDIEPDDGKYGEAKLDFARPFLSPCRFARVQLLDSGNQILTETHTDEKGVYFFESLSVVQEVKVRVLAETVALGTQSASIRVQDNTNNDALYAADSDLVNLAEVRVLNMEIPTGYDSTGIQAVGTVRSSAPFACLDGILTGYRFFLSGGLEADVLPTCLVNWSEQNRPEGPALAETQEAALEDGRIGTSSFQSHTNQLYILGFRQADTDEFDWHIMIHEFGHWVQSNAFRDNSFGGSHSGGELKDPRLAFSEGFGNALGGLALEDAVYKDTTSMDGFSFSLECNLGGQSDPNPGWFSEATVQTVLFDLFDPRRSEGGDSNYSDQVELPLSYFISSLSSQSKSPALTTIFSFLSGLVQRGLNSDQSSELTNLLAFESPQSSFGLNSLNEFGVGETHDGSIDSLPLYREVDALIDGGAFTLTIPGQPEEGVYNSLEGFRNLKFTGDGSTITVTAFNSTSTVGAIAIALFEDGQLLTQEVDEESEDGVDNNRMDSTITRLTKVGSTYVAILINTSTDASTTDIELTR
jgi:hypothetical protein